MTNEKEEGSLIAVNSSQWEYHQNGPS